MTLSTIILTLNEAGHIRRCIESLRPLDGNVFVVDSFSTDRTVEIARELGAQVVQNAWQGLYAIQFNWALDNLPIKTDWVLRLDADEYLSPELIEEIKEKLDTLPEDVAGVTFHLRRVFMGRVIRRGMPRITMLRLFRYGKARCEQRLMDEHIELLKGRTVEFENDFADDNLNDLGWWTAKHNGYALREAADLLDMEYGLFSGDEPVDKNSSPLSQALSRALSGKAQEMASDTAHNGGRRAAESHAAAEACRPPEEESGADQVSQEPLPSTLRPLGGRNDGFATTPTHTPAGDKAHDKVRPGAQARLAGQAAKKRRMKLKYVRAPLFWRSFAYFCYRYFLRGGFLEGKEGFLWHFLQGWWYRTLVDARVWEIKRESGGDRGKMLELLRGKYGLKI
jgi:glycosyltransferase involved in cell wall biosynthesis